MFGCDIKNNLAINGNIGMEQSDKDYGYDADECSQLEVVCNNEKEDGEYYLNDDYSQQSTSTVWMCECRYNFRAIR
jgi:hypothetical protein